MDVVRGHGVAQGWACLSNAERHTSGPATTDPLPLLVYFRAAATAQADIVRCARDQPYRALLFVGQALIDDIQAKARRRPNADDVLCYAALELQGSAQASAAAETDFQIPVGVDHPALEVLTALFGIGEHPAVKWPTAEIPDDLVEGVPDDLAVLVTEHVSAWDVDKVAHSGKFTAAFQSDDLIEDVFDRWLPLSRRWRAGGDAHRR
jgi:hypothetical protein